MSKVKEPGYFFENSKLTLGQYAENYKHYKGEKAIGEASLYLCGNGNAERIKKLVPDAKFIFCLRDPIERALSHYQYRLGRGDELRSFNELIESELIEFPMYYSMYYSHTKEFMSIFSKEQCLVIIAEKMRRNFKTTLKQICRFLQVNEHFPVHIEGNKNITLPAKKKLPNAVKNWNRGSGLKRGNFNRPGLSEEANISFYKEIMLNFLQKWMMTRAKCERRAMIKSLSSRSRNKLVAMFDFEKSNLENLIGFKINEWNCNGLKKKL